MAAGGNNFNNFVFFFIFEQHRKLKIKKSRVGNWIAGNSASFCL